MKAFITGAMLAAGTITAPASASIVDLNFKGVLSGNLFPNGSSLEFHASYDDNLQPSFGDDQVAFYNTPDFDFVVNGKKYDGYSYQYGNVSDDGVNESFDIPFRFLNSDLGLRYTTFDLKFSATGLDLIHNLQLPDATALSHFNGLITLSADDDTSRASTATFVQGVSAVPEAATWAMMIVGFVSVGGAMRYRRKANNVTYA